MTSVTAHDSESAARREAECVYHHHLPKQSLTQYDSTHPQKPPPQRGVACLFTRLAIADRSPWDRLLLSCDCFDHQSIVFRPYSVWQSFSTLIDYLGTVWQSFSTPIDYLGTVFSCCSSRKHSLH
ncbi:hypothetical protein PGT21_025806 [Puccinia graminis f. sp. tritici]|uniref:Uncharacterized protein n=1 Tax=Puccinia graminis f. sp. tritici TaxID=56615 RepID=A0A5B0PV01_PUCGR|nr:hypothetical protein PGT21_025806 [Puccinia graminis f. sp. tritici]